MVCAQPLTDQQVGNSLLATAANSLDDILIVRYLPSTFKPAVKHFRDSFENSPVCFGWDCNVVHTAKQVKNITSITAK